MTYQIVGEDEADIKNGKISVNAGARALIGKYAGDIAQVQAGGLREYRNHRRPLRIASGANAFRNPHRWWSAPWVAAACGRSATGWRPPFFQPGDRQLGGAGGRQAVSLVGWIGLALTAGWHLLVFRTGAARIQERVRFLAGAGLGCCC